MRQPSLFLLAFVCSLFTITAGAQQREAEPQSVVQRYLRFGAAGNLVGARALIDAGCNDTAVGRVEAVMVLGARMRLRSVTLTVISQSSQRARVRYSITGSASGQNTQTTILGANVRIGGLRVSTISKTGTLDLLSSPRGWVVACR